VWSAATPATPGRDRRLPRARILRRRSDFHAIRGTGGTESGSHLKLNWRRVPGDSRRMAAIVSKACGPAVTRNRIKRRIREAWRHLQSDLAPGLDSVWISRPKAGTAGLETLREEMSRLYRKAGVWGAPS